MTLDDTVGFLNLVLETKLTDQEEKDLVAFMRQLERAADGNERTGFAPFRLHCWLRSDMLRATPRGNR